jgi:serine/threonine protein kinase
VSPRELEYEKSKRLGSGSYGDVYRGKLRSKEVAIKKFSYQQFDDDLVNDFKKEVEMLAKLRRIFDNGDYTFTVKIQMSFSFLEL